MTLQPKLGWLWRIRTSGRPIACAAIALYLSSWDGRAAGFLVALLALLADCNPLLQCVTRPA